MSFGEHLDELRRRLIFALLGVIPVMAVSLLFGKALLRFVIAPVEHALIRAGESPTLQALSPVESFGAYLKVAMVATLVISIPWCLWQLWLFVRPGLYPNEQRFARFLVPLASVLSLAGAAFLYYVLLPLMLYFLILFGAGIAQQPPPTAEPPPGVTIPTIPILAADPINPEPGAMWVLESRHQLRIHLADGEIVSSSLTSAGLVAQQYRIAEYVDLVFLLILVFALTFQTPVVIMLLSWSGLVDHKFLASKRKHVVLICVVLAAVITPTGDPVSLALLAGPLYLLFEFGLILARAVPPRRVAAGVLSGKRTTDGDSEP
ncbi:MAG: twin-arginine translocase subunit TatC [Phycisphaerales bacterium]